MNNVVDLHTLSHQIHRENILNLKSHFFVQFRYYCCPIKLDNNKNSVLDC